MGRHESLWEIGDKPERLFWFAEEFIEEAWDSKFCASNNKYYVFQHFKNINKKFIGVHDVECSLEYANIFGLLEHQVGYSPYDPTKDEYISYTFDEFVELVDSRRWGVEIKSPLSRDQYWTYKIKKENNGLFTVEHPKYLHYWTKVPLNVIDDYNRRFEGSEEEIKGRWQGVPKKKIMTPITIDELFKRLPPFYLNRYLLNGKLYIGGKY